MSGTFPLARNAFSIILLRRPSSSIGRIDCSQHGHSPANLFAVHRHDVRHGATGQCCVRDTDTWFTPTNRTHHCEAGRVDVHIGRTHPSCWNVVTLCNTNGTWRAFVFRRASYGKTSSQLLYKYRALSDHRIASLRSIWSHVFDASPAGARTYVATNNFERAQYSCLLVPRLLKTTTQWQRAFSDRRRSYYVIMMSRGYDTVRRDCFADSYEEKTNCFPVDSPSRQFQRCSRSVRNVYEKHSAKQLFSLF